MRLRRTVPYSRFTQKVSEVFPGQKVSLVRQRTHMLDSSEPPAFLVGNKNGTRSAIVDERGGRHLREGELSMRVASAGIPRAVMRIRRLYAWRDTLPRMRSLLFPHLISLGSVFLAAALGVLASLLQTPRVAAFPDSYQYLAAAHRLLATRQLTDPYRTPGYPAFLALIFLLTGGEHWGAVVAAQAALIILAAVEIYVLVYRVAERRWVAALIASVAGLDLYFTAWARVLPSEAPSYWMLVTLVLVFERYLRTARRSFLVALTLLSALAILVRPQLIYLPILFIAILALRAARLHQFRRVWRPLAVSLAVTYALILAYMGANAREQGLFSLSKVSSINLLGKVMELNARDHMPLTGADPRFGPLVADIERYRPRGDAWGFLKAHPEYDSPSGSLYATFSLQVLAHHPLTTLLGDYQDFSTTISPSLTPAMLVPYGQTSLWIVALTQLSRLPQLAYGPLPFLLLVYALFAWRRPSQTSTILIFTLLAVTVLHSIVAAAGDYESFDRLRFPVDWAMLAGALLAALASIDRIAGRLRRRPSASRAWDGSDDAAPAG